MRNLIKNYVSRLTKDQIRSFALMHNIILSEEELNFTHSFVKENYEILFTDFDNFNIDQYKCYYKEENFPKIKALFMEYSQKFKPFIK